MVDEHLLGSWLPPCVQGIAAAAALLWCEGVVHVYLYLIVWGMACLLGSVQRQPHVTCGTSSDDKQHSMPLAADILAATFHVWLCAY